MRNALASAREPAVTTFSFPRNTARIPEATPSAAGQRVRAVQRTGVCERPDPHIGATGHVRTTLLPVAVFGGTDPYIFLWVTAHDLAWATGTYGMVLCVLTTESIQIGPETTRIDLRESQCGR